MAEDEPACDKLRTENEQITAYLMSCKEKQLDLLANIKALKEEKNKHIQRKVRNSLSAPTKVIIILLRKLFMSRWTPSQTTLAECAHELSNRQTESNVASSLWALPPPKIREQ